MEGSVFQADSLTRKELVQFAPFSSVENTIVSPDNAIALGETDTLFYLDTGISPPKFIVSFLFHLIEGEVTVHVEQKVGMAFESMQHTFVDTGTYVLFNSPLNKATVTGIGITSLYDWVVGYTEV